MIVTKAQQVSTDTEIVDHFSFRSAAENCEVHPTDESISHLWLSCMTKRIRVVRVLYYQREATKYERQNE